MKIFMQSNNNQRVNKYYVYGHYTNNGQLFYIGTGTLGYTNKDLDFKSILSKQVISEDKNGVKHYHNSITDCAKFLCCARESVRDALKRNGNCKGHKIYLKDNQQPSP